MIISNKKDKYMKDSFIDKKEIKRIENLKKEYVQVNKNLNQALARYEKTSNVLNKNLLRLANKRFLAMFAENPNLEFYL